jgi:hypothetical protein
VAVFSHCPLNNLCPGWGSCSKSMGFSLLRLQLVRRLEMLENQCSVWPDPIAAVVYVPTVQGRISSEDAFLNGRVLGEAVARASAFFERMQLQGGRARALGAVTRARQPRVRHCELGGPGCSIAGLVTPAAMPECIGKAHASPQHIVATVKSRVWPHAAKVL